MNRDAQIKGDRWYAEIREQYADSIPVGESRAVDVALPPPDESLGMFLRYVLAQIAAKEPASDNLVDTNVYQQTKNRARRWIAMPAGRTPEMAMELLQIFDNAGIDLRVPYEVDFYGTAPPAGAFPAETAMLPDERYIEGNIGIHPQCAGIATADNPMGSEPYKIYKVEPGVKVLPLLFFNGNNRFNANRKKCNVLIFGPLRANIPTFREGFESNAVFVRPISAGMFQGLRNARDNLGDSVTETFSATGPIWGRATRTFEGARQRAQNWYNRLPGGRGGQRVSVPRPGRRASQFPDRNARRAAMADYPEMFAAQNI